MTKYTQMFLLFAALLLVAAIQAQDQCPKNQQFTNCGTACPPKCNDDRLSFCTLQCIIGCQCKPGYLLNVNNECVAPKDC